MRKNYMFILLLSLTFYLPLQAHDNEKWSRVMDAIIQVESEGDVNAKSGNSAGPMQITPVFVEECNRILELKKSAKRYTLEDRWDLKKSKEMFILFQKAHNPQKDVEFAIRSWNGGPKFKMKATDSYYKKVLAAMK